MSYVDEPEEDFDDKIYEEYRAELVRDRENASANFDKNLITVSGGALAISITFINQIAPNPTQMWLCKIAWGLFTLALTSTLFSFFSSGQAREKAIKDLDDGAKRSKLVFGKLNRWNIWTFRANITSLISFICGIILLVVFVMLNAAPRETNWLSNFFSYVQETSMAKEENRSTPQSLEEGTTILRPPVGRMVPEVGLPPSELIDSNKDISGGLTLGRPRVTPTETKNNEPAPSQPSNLDNNEKDK